MPFLRRSRQIKGEHEVRPYGVDIRFGMNVWNNVSEKSDFVRVRETAIYSNAAARSSPTAVSFSSTATTLTPLLFSMGIGISEKKVSR